MKFVTYTNEAAEIDAVEMPFIYPDDSIDIVWYKLSEHYRCHIEDICLFAKKIVSFTPEQVYKQLSDETGDIPWFHYKNYANNFEFYIDVKKEPVTLDVISKTSFVGVMMSVSLGQKMLLTANPLLAENISEYGSTPVYKQDSAKLLLDYFPLVDDTVYVCLKKDFEGKSMYYDHKVDVDLIKRRLSGLSEIYHLPTRPPLERIVSLSCTISPLISLSVSLDTIFSILHVSETMPMIQYNTGSEETLLYKLYTEEYDIAGNKIPYLESSKVLKRDQSYPKSITAFFKDEVKFAFKEDGSVIFDIKCKQGECTIEDMNKKINKHLSAFHLVQHFMEQSGYVYPEFTSVEDCSTMKFSVYFEFAEVPTFTEHNCRHKFFIKLDDKERRYIRVSEFEESKFIYEVCLALLLNNTSVDKIVRQLQETFSMTQEQAQTVWKTYETDLQVLKAKNENKKVSLKEKEGFTSIITSSQNIVSVEVRDVPSVHYLPEIRRNVGAYVALCTTPNKITCAKMEVQAAPVHELVMDVDMLEIDSDEEVLEIDSDEEMSGGAVDKDLILKNDSFLITRIKSVFAADPQFKEKEFTKKCPLKRCPIALTSAEEGRVKKHPTFKVNDRTFVCPKYWDMQNKIPLTEADLKLAEHKDKRVIDKKTVKEKRSIDFKTDGTILELETGDYPYPGMLAKAYGPCCFKLNPKVKKQEAKPVIEALQRIIEDRNRPMEATKVARLPKPLQFFFGLPETCMMSKNNYLLRYGVPSPHSFMDCIVTCYQLYKKGSTKETVLKALGKLADKYFKKLNNGRIQKQFTLEDFKSHMEQMDYTYLWELVCLLLNINLIVLRIPNETDVELVCPSNRYMLTPFNPAKVSFIILERQKKREVRFEPIIEHNIQKNDHALLHEYHNPFLLNTFKEIEKHYDKCNPYSEFYSTNMTADALYQNLQAHFKVSQVIHDSMCIGLVVDKVYIPSYPSIPLEKITETDIDHAVSSYKHTVSTLNKVSDFCPCKPRFKVVSNGIVYGVVTQTNSYVPCLQEQHKPDDLPLYRGKVDYEYTSVSKVQDAKRILLHRQSEAEKYCYMEFRRRVKDALHRNKQLRATLQDHIKNKTVMEEHVHTILPKYTSLPSNEDSLQKILNCKAKYTCSEIYIPETNLVTGLPNQYFKRMATELNRYTRISTFVLNPQLYIPDTHFTVNDDEMILIGQSAEAYLNELKEPRRFEPTYDNAVAFHQEKVSDLIVKKLMKIKLTL